jgi:hypothetical protein
MLARNLKIAVNRITSRDNVNYNALRAQTMLGGHFIGRVIHVLVFNPSYISTILWLYLLILTEL